MWLFAVEKLLFDKIQHFRLRQFWGFASVEGSIFFNQLLQEFSSNQFETLDICYKYIEDVHVTYWRWKKQLLTKSRHFGLSQIWGYAVILDSNSPRIFKQSMRNYAEMFQRCFKHTEDTHVTFLRKKQYFFDKITAFATLTVQTIVNSMDWICSGSGVGMGWGVGWGLEQGIICVLQIQFSSFKIMFETDSD